MNYVITLQTSNAWILPPIARDMVLGEIVREHERSIFLHCVTVMPDHVHLVGTPLHPLSRIVRKIKGRSTRFINEVVRRTGVVWREESFDHALRHDEPLREKCEHVCGSPVRAGLVADADEYPWIWRRRELAAQRLNRLHA